MHNKLKVINIVTIGYNNSLFLFLSLVPLLVIGTCSTNNCEYIVSDSYSLVIQLHSVSLRLHCKPQSINARGLVPHYTACWHWHREQLDSYPAAPACSRPHAS